MAAVEGWPADAVLEAMGAGREDVACMNRCDVTRVTTCATVRS